MNFIVLEETYSIYRFKSESDLPDWIYSSDFYSITKTKDEVSLVAVQNDSVSDSIICNRDWRILKIQGPLDFSMTGIIAEITSILSDKKISVFTVSTYDTDYIMVKQRDLDIAIEALLSNGHIISKDK